MMIERFGARAIALAVMLVAMILLVGLAVHLINQSRSAGTQARVSKGQEQASTDSGAEAMNTVSAVQEKERQTDQTVKEGSDAIHNASEADRGTVTVAQLCRLRINRDKQRCAALREAGSGQPAQAH